MPNHKAYKTSRANTLRWKHGKVERFERLLKREQKALNKAAENTMQLIARYPTNSSVYFERWLTDMQVFQKNIEILEAKIRGAGLCPVRVPYLVSRVASIAIM
jgi:hypothetical protein